MFAAAPPLVSWLIRYWLIGEALKFATGTSKRDLAAAALDASEQIGNIYTTRLASGQAAGLVPELLTSVAGIVGAPGTIAEAAGYTFEGEFARQQQRLASEIAGGLPTTRVRIKGAPTFARRKVTAVKRKLSSWNRDVKKAYAEVKKKRNSFGIPGKINVPKKAFPKIVKIVAAVRKGKKQKSKAGKQIRKVLGYALKRGKR
jgi:hypothetical protein